MEELIKHTRYLVKEFVVGTSKALTIYFMSLVQFCKPGSQVNKPAQSLHSILYPFQ